MMRKSELNDYGAMGPSVDSPAEDIIFDAWDGRTPAARRKLARKALKVDLDAYDAYTVLATEAESVAERLALAREAVRIGDRLWAPLLDDGDVHWYGFIGTRSYMRAIHTLGLALEESGDEAEAEVVYARLLEMNPNDNQGIRCLITHIYMKQGRDDDLRALMNDYPGDGQIESVMACFYLDLKGAKGKKITSLAKKVDERNAFVLAQLTGKGRKEKDIEFSPYGITMGGEDEAFDYADRFGAVWKREKPLLKKLADHVASQQT